MRRTLIVMALVFATTAFAGSKNVAIVEGRVDKIDHHQITLLVQGKPVVVPRDSIPDYYSISYSNVVTAYVTAKGLTRKTASK